MTAPPGQINPYKLGIELFRLRGGARRHDIFRLRRVHNDVSLVHKLVDETFAMSQILPIVAGAPGQSEDSATAEVDWRQLKQWLLHQLSWGGMPQIELVGTNAKGGELILAHHHDGRDLQMGQARETLMNLAALWKRPVHLMTTLEKESRRLIATEDDVSVVDAHEADWRQRPGGAARRRAGRERVDRALHLPGREALVSAGLDGRHSGPMATSNEFHRHMSRARAARVFAFVALVTLAGCRKGSGNTVAAFVARVPSSAGAHGANGADQPFGAISAVSLPANAPIGATSQVVAAQGSDRLYMTTLNGDLVELDFDPGPAPVDPAPVILSAAEITATLGIATPSLSGIAVLAAVGGVPQSFAVAEHTTHSILLSDRLGLVVPGGVDPVARLAGSPSGATGFANTPPAADALFRLDGPVQLCPTSNLPPELYVPDPGNNRVRLLVDVLVETALGSGAACSMDADLLGACVQSPSAALVGANGQLLVLDTGGHLLRAIDIGSRNFFSGELAGTSFTLAGDGEGTASVEGVGSDASLASPQALAGSLAGELYWVDAGTGILRRMTASGLVDCPLAASCAGPGNFTPGGAFSMTVGADGTLFVLDVAAGTLYRID